MMIVVRELGPPADTFLGGDPSSTPVLARRRLRLESANGVYVAMGETL